jgi:dienelactone hydrolase
MRASGGGRRALAACLAVLAAAWLGLEVAGGGGGPGRAGPPSSPAVLREALLMREFSAWNGLLNALYRDAVSLEPDSSQPKNYLIALTDGVRGSFADFPGSFVLFDGPVAAVRVQLPSWRRVGSLSFNTVEVGGQPPPAVALRHEQADGAVREVALARTEREWKGNVVLAQYAARLEPAARGGELVVRYDNHELAFAFVDELVLDGLGDGRTPAFPALPADLAAWQATHGPAERARVEAATARPLADRELLHALMGEPSSGVDSRLVFLERLAAPGGGALYALALRVDATGVPLLDIVRAFLRVPDRPGRLPLVVLNHQGTTFGAAEPVGLLGRRELGLAEELAGQGVASLAVEMLNGNGFAAAPAGNPRVTYQYHPRWSITGKEADNTRRALSYVLGPEFAADTGVDLDDSRIGAIGYSFGALNSLIFALEDGRYRFVAMSHLENYSRDWDNFAPVFYVPQLTFLRGRDPYPLHVCRLVQSLARDGVAVLASVGDPGLQAHYRECLGPADTGVRIALNPIGKVFTLSERAAFLDFIFERLGIRARAEREGPTYALDEDPAPYRDRDNAWRTSILDNFARAR